MSINRAAGGDRPDLLDAVAADTDVPVVEIDGWIAVAGDQPDLVAEPEPVGGGRDGEPSMLVGGALAGRAGSSHTSGGPDRSESSVQFLLTAPSDVDLHPFFHELRRARQTDAAVGAGDSRDRSFKSAHRVPTAYRMLDSTSGG